MTSTPQSDAAASTGNPSDKCVIPSVRLACVEICRFRRLCSVRVPIDAETTILVGANNSGKTSILAAMRQFLAESPVFGVFDLSVDQWPKLRELGESWESLDEAPASKGSDPLIWERQLHELFACMLTLDLWFDAQPGAFHIVRHFIPSLKWRGGPVGIRLRLEPASDVDELQKLAWRFREARQQVSAHGRSARAWPTDLLDYWLRHSEDLRSTAVYRLDPAKSPLCPDPAEAPQELPTHATRLERAELAPLVKVDFVAAQRGLGAEEADGRAGSEPHRMGLFSNQLLRFAQRHFNVAGPRQGSYPELVQAIAAAQGDLDTKIQSALEPVIKDVAILGYPGLHDPKEIHLRTRIQTGDLLDHSTAVQYRLEGCDDAFLPEHVIGLGYQNLQSLSYQLVSFRETRLNPYKGAPAAVHLVLLEEPEAHLHVQVQRAFPKAAPKLISPKGEDHAHLASQLILTTHASHLAHAEDFTRLRYVRRLMPYSRDDMHCSEVTSLADAFGADEETRIFAERYFQVQHTDLLFADAAIFVEGIAERMLVPFFIDRDFPELRTRYLSFVEIGGSHAHRLKPLVERLGIPTVVITDIDPVKATTGANGRTSWTATVIDDPTDLRCGNDTLTQWHPRIERLKDYTEPSRPDPVWVASTVNKVRFAWQMPTSPNGPWPSSFEDAFIFENLDWFKHQTGQKGALGSAVRAVTESADPTALNERLHCMLHGSFSKGDFAATIFERLCSGEDLRCPGYIADALTWLEVQLTTANKAAEP